MHSGFEMEQDIRNLKHLLVVPMNDFPFDSMPTPPLIFTGVKLLPFLVIALH